MFTLLQVRGFRQVKIKMAYKVTQSHWQSHGLQVFPN